jgi:carboxyl-terminal processing protease
MREMKHTKDTKDDQSINISSVWGALKKKSVATMSMVALLTATTISTPLTVDVNLDFSSPESHQTISIVQSRAFALTEEQLLVDDVWKEVNRQFVDRTFNGLGEEGWRKERLDAVKKVSRVGPDEKEQVYEVIRNMLSSLGDPYTRFLTPDQFESLTAYARGSSVGGGIGVQLMGDPSSGKIVVINTIKDGPAAKAGVLPGDIIEEVDGKSIEGATAEVVAANCRGEAGTVVSLAIHHGGDGKPDDKLSQLSFTRTQIKSKSVETSTFATSNGKTVGLIKVSSFNQETASTVLDALREVGRTSAVVVDLRGNGGGYMPAGVDAAKLFLAPKAIVISEIDKSGRATIYINDGVGSETELPLFLLVDKRTASASEIFAAALQDNHRATVVGTTTFGKGRIQNIQGPLGDGSGISVTKAKYLTPLGNDIHGIGITPDKESTTCGPNDSAAACLTGLI